MEKISEFLKVARSKLATPQSWCKTLYAKDKYDSSCCPRSSRAVSFCMIGALDAVKAPEGARARLQEAINELERVGEWKPSNSFDTRIVTFNDTTNHALVLKAFDIAIQKSEKLETA